MWKWQKRRDLPPRDIERRYILRPTLPTIITNFALLVITLWTGFTITETVFLWPGLGITLFQAIGLYDTPGDRWVHHHLRLFAGNHCFLA